MPQRFDLTYVGADGEKHRPIMIHRVIFGSIERFIGILIEHTAGKFPLWLAPVQVRLLTVTEKYGDYARKVAKILEDNNLRVQVDLRNEKIGYKLREARNERVSYIGVIGEREEESGTLTVRSSKTGELGEMSIEDFAHKLCGEIENKDI
jgi:threonyl-tRNA synthetase